MRALNNPVARPIVTVRSAKKPVFFQNAVLPKRTVISPTTLCNRLVCNASDAAAEVETEEILADKLDIRVGKVLKAWKHPEADRLFVEEVDVGEEEPRTICSGLFGYVPEEELQGRPVVVLCNLKPRNMAGIKSNGMLLAASDEAHETVQLLSPPADAPIGERVKFGSLDCTQRPADTPNRVQKKKVFEAVQPDLNTSDERVVRYKELEMLTSTGTVTVATLAGASVS
eukprot:CAMPEP_0118922384 /NCGR_PEP_ID=MMETSP1169-20130426/1330_1 /TAXON_ID=36882 /ORGANISM="Pyramimonas obovata, Strain CCMP722" /LENGTH=227 /DNA_ID=CAMNT_0006863243 /DNA_START=159 /DNA_END=842 /DNA_ORIENTATION=-